MEKVDLIEQKELLQNDSTKKQSQCQQIIEHFQQYQKLWEKIGTFLQINAEFCNVSDNKPTKSLKRNKNMQERIGGHLIKEETVVKEKKKKKRNL